MSGTPWLSVVIPALDEAQRLVPTLDRILRHLRADGRPFEVVVVDDGSSDGTHLVAADAGPEVRVVRFEENRGKGAAVRAGVAASTGDLVLMSDADMSTPIEEVHSLVRRLEEGAGVAIASRSVAGARLEERQPRYRELMGKVFNLIVQALLLPGIWDTQCGFKLFRGDHARRVFPLVRTEGFAFDVEVLYLSRRLGQRIEEVPVEWRNSPQSRVHALRDSSRMFLEVVRIRLARRPELAAAVAADAGER